MKNMVYCLLCNIILVAFVILTSSCSNGNETPVRDFLLEHPSMTLYGSPVQIRFGTKKPDTVSLAEKVSDRYNKDMMRWAEYSSLYDMP